MAQFDYVRDPEEIYRRSFQTIRDEVALDGILESLHPVVLRIVHSCGMPGIVSDLRWHGDPAGEGRRALEAGAAILTDTRMVAAGIIRPRLPGDNEIICPLHDAETKALAKAQQTTRSSAGVDRWVAHVAGAVCVIGNAPTALFRLLEILSDPETPRPAAIFAFPVGFVGAAESKDALVAADLDIPFLTLLGRCGGSAMAAAAVNALGSPRS